MPRSKRKLNIEIPKSQNKKALIGEEWVEGDVDGVKYQVRTV
ncbi:hypothetical protein O9929_19430 [Vibrio lentus]|nr:hypothetical protein [Vibrio lentus]